MQTRALIDLRTALLLAFQTAGLAALYVLHVSVSLPWWAAGVLATLLMNLSFTTWHECSHGNFSRSQWINHTAGVVSSFFSLYPGYFARRREHLAHHRWEGDEKMDPVYPRIQAGFFAFPFLLSRLIVTRGGNPVPDEFLPFTSAQRWVDRLTLLFAFGGMALISYLGHFEAVLWLLLLPRLVVFYLHAVYICWLPHSVKGGGFERYRVADHGLFWRFLTVGQWAHGVHHKEPNIPWHGYRRALTARNE